MTGKSTRITVDLGSDELVKALKIAAVEHRRTVRDIVVEALAMWLASVQTPARKAHRDPATAVAEPSTADKDYRSMMETLNRYRGVGGK
ncbi:MAG: hypothetical protein E4G93_04410 [Dehalococcoidia bacterium]|nr:MAG: hypothetical protein E4G93_04410 [Dehalococcoidia bacterium]